MANARRKDDCKAKFLETCEEITDKIDELKETVTGEAKESIEDGLEEIKEKLGDAFDEGF